jgi:hypothetical protein
MRGAIGSRYRRCGSDNGFLQARSWALEAGTQKSALATDEIRRLEGRVDTPTRVFSEKRLQTIENKGNERRKGRKETTRRLQAAANKRVGRFEHPRTGKRRNTEATE